MIRRLLVAALGLALLGATSLSADIVTPVSATATSSFFNFPSLLIDGSGLIDNGGSLETQLHDNNENNMWLANGPAEDQELEFVLDGNYDLSTAYIWQHNGLDGGGQANFGRGMMDFEILVSADLEAPFVSLGTFSMAEATNPFADPPQGEPAQAFALSNAAAGNVRRVKFDVIDAWGGNLENFMGLSEVRFDGTLLPPVEDRIWFVDGIGSWHVGTNWNPIEAPAGNDQDAIFGGVITAPTTVVVDQVAVVRNITFDNAQTYALAGTSRIELTSNTGSSSIEVLTGQHEFQVPLHLMNDATISTGGTDQSLAINHRLVLGGHNLTITAGSQVSINNTIDDTAGGMVINNGTLRGGGRVNGDLANGGVVAPGDPLGNLTVDGQFQQSTSGTLAIAIASSGHDRLTIGGTASLDGTVSVELLDGFDPAPGSEFEILVATGGITSHDLLLSGPAASTFSLVVNANSVILAVGGGLTCDFDGGGCGLSDIDALVTEIAAGTNNGMFDVNGDGNVDTGDLDDWLAAAGAANLASGNAYLYGDANLDGSVDVSDFNAWNSNKFGRATWSSGDFNADGSADVTDFNVWNSNKFMSADGAAVPEPDVSLGWWLAAIGVGRLRSRRRSSWSRPSFVRGLQ